METLDKIDLRILKVLQAQARITNQDLADEIHLSPSSCLMRVRKLEQLGVLESYHEDSRSGVRNPNPCLRQIK